MFCCKHGGCRIPVRDVQLLYVDVRAAYPCLANEGDGTATPSSQLSGCYKRRRSSDPFSFLCSEMECSAKHDRVDEEIRRPSRSHRIFFFPSFAKYFGVDRVEQTRSTKGALNTVSSNRLVHVPSLSLFFGGVFLFFLLQC